MAYTETFDMHKSQAIDIAVPYDIGVSYAIDRSTLSGSRGVFVCCVKKVKVVFI